jgi:metallo-beta-lactamase family protein
MRITFYGATGTVTGSRFMVEHQGLRILVDCGLYQGLRVLRQRNWDTFPVPPSSVDAVVLTHAHIDHSGMLPVLVRDGFRGPIYCTPGSADLLRILLPDAAHLQEEEARYRNKEGATRHNPALPLYTAADSEAVLKQLEPIPPHTEIDLG